MRHPQSPVVEKIKKLLALADGNQNEHERAVAMQFAMELLPKHNLSLSEIQQSSATIDVEEVVGDFRTERWIHFVLQATCELFYTDFFTSKRWLADRGVLREVPVFVGTADNIAVTIEVSTWLISSIRLESNRSYETPNERRSFRLGASWRLLMRAIEMVVDEEIASNNKSGTSLIVVRHHLTQANEHYMATKKLRHRRVRRSSVCEQAFSDGESYGNQLKFGKQPKMKKSSVPRLPYHN